MKYTHEANNPNIRYFANGYIKLIDGDVFVREYGTYVYDFYHEEDKYVTPANECSENVALEEFMKIYGTDDGFYTYEV